VSDHGEIVAEDGGHGMSFSSDEAHVPLILHAPRFAGHTVVPTFTNHVDFAPTVAALFGLKAAERWAGRDLLALKVPARMLFVLVRQSGIAGLIDNGIAFAVRSERPGEAYRVGDLKFEPLPSGAMPEPMLAAYRNALSSFDARVLLSHVDVGGEQRPGISPVQSTRYGGELSDIVLPQVHQPRHAVQRAWERIETPRNGG